jgi:bifunctional DNA-binding transcriptional regulator/antitoxin component of YhaV-PrlF toxin-antitoxin module
MKTYIAKVVEITNYGDAILQFPKLMIKDLKWKIGDRLEFDIIDDNVIVKNVSAMLRSKTEQENIIE